MATRRQSVQLKKAFLASYRDTGNIRLSCEMAAVARSTVYKWQEHDEVFDAAFGQAQIEAVEALEAEALRRAVKGIVREKPIFYKGENIGTEFVHEYSDLLLIFLLKGAAPQKYRERVDLRHGGDADEPIRVEYTVEAEDVGVGYPTS